MSKVGDYNLTLGKSRFVPIVIGGMGVNISTADMALEACRLGGIGHISDAMVPFVCDKYFGTSFVNSKGKANAAAPKFDKTNVKFSTHIATVVMTPGASARYFNCMKKNGYTMDTAGISFYPSAPSMYADSMILFKKTVMAINNKCGLPVFVGEFSYPSGEMSGAFAGWNKVVKGYPNTEEGQANMFRDVIDWGKTHGVIGVRYWAADYEDWGTMGLFRFENKHGIPKTGLAMDLGK